MVIGGDFCEEEYFGRQCPSLGCAGLGIEFCNNKRSIDEDNAFYVSWHTFYSCILDTHCYFPQEFYKNDKKRFKRRIRGRACHIFRFLSLKQLALNTRHLQEWVHNRDLCGIGSVSSLFFTGQFPKITQILSAIITFIGLGMVSIDESFTVNFGDVLTLAGALFFAMQIVLTEHFVKRADPINITIIQTALTGILSLALGLFMEPMPQLMKGRGICYYFCSGSMYAGAFTVQNIAQKHTDSTHAAILLCMESVSSGFFSFLLWNEVFTLRMLIGFGLILFGS